MKKNSYSYDDLINCGEGKLFGPGNAKLPLPPMLMFDRITEINDNKGTFNTPIEVVYYDKNGQEISREWVKTDSSITFLKGPPDSENAAIDPDQYMPDIFRSNNVTQRKLSAHFIFERPSYHDIDINFMPWIFSYNTYNGFTPGLTLWNGFTPGHGKRGTFLNLLYDVNNNKVNKNAFFI